MKNNIQNIKNNILQKRMDYWLNKMPVSRRALEHEGIYGFLLAMDETANVRNISNKVLNDFVDGLVFLPYTIKKNDSESTDFIETLVRPGLNFIESYIKNEYQDFLINQEVSGEDILRIQNIEIPISQKQIKQHIKRTKKIPVTTEDIARITADFVEYKKRLYQPSPTYIHPYVDTINPINFCGDTILHQVDCDLYQVPYDIVEPKKGEHDYKTCQGCIEFKTKLEQAFRISFWGNGKDHMPFPYCCERHKNLVLQEGLFNLDDFISQPESVATKVIYTRQQILNCIELESWFEDITDYIAYAVNSFGKYPSKCGMPLFLNHYYDQTYNFLQQQTDLPRWKIDRLIKFINSKDSENQSDFNILIQTYEKWYKTFPFDLNDYFGYLKENYKTHFPIFYGRPTINQYTGEVRVKAHSKESLIAYLLKLTNTIITQINGLTLLEKGLINDADKIQLDLINQQRRIIISEGYINQSQNEDEGYRKILKRWLKDEIEYIQAITPLLKSEKQNKEAGQKEKSKAEKLTIELQKYNFFSIDKVSELTDEGKKRIVQFICNNKLPYAIAMIDYLGFLFYLEKNYFTQKYKLYKEIAKWFGTQDRTIKGNISSLIPNTTENLTRYTAYKYKKIVEEDYKNIK